MNDKKFSKQDQMVSLNDALYEGFSVEELEKRLETAPWICGGYVDADVDIDVDIDSIERPEQIDSLP